MSIKSKLRKIVGLGGDKRRIKHRMGRYVKRRGGASRRKRNARGRFVKRGRR